MEETSYDHSTVLTAILTNCLAKFFTLKNSGVKEFKCILIDFSKFHFLFTNTPEHNNRNSFLYALFSLKACCCIVHILLSSVFRYKIKGYALVSNNQISFLSLGAAVFQIFFFNKMLTTSAKLGELDCVLNADINTRNMRN